MKEEEVRDRIVERFDHLRPIIERRSDDPFAAMWRELQRFEGDDAAARAMNARSIDNTERLHALRNEVRLADAFYLAYRDAEEIIDPILLYYGAYALSKAIAHASLEDDAYREWQKRPTHGVSSRIQDTLAASTITFQNNGTVHALAHSLGGEAPRDVRLNALDLFRYVPELDAILTDIGYGSTTALRIMFDEDEYGASSVFPHLEHVIVSNAGAAITNADFKREVAVQSELENRHVNLMLDACQLSWNKRLADHSELYFMAMRTPAGLFFERRLPSGLYLPELAVHLVLLHLLADFARYRPSEWISMVDRHTDEYALVREFIHVSEGKFPNLVLNELAERTFIFSHS